MVKLNVDEINFVAGGYNGIAHGVIAGLSFGFVELALLRSLKIPLGRAAVAGAFANRFATGFLIPNTQLPVTPWLKGASVGLLLSIPDAIRTGNYAPILGIGVLGGAIIGKS